MAIRRLADLHPYTPHDAAVESARHITVAELRAAGREYLVANGYAQADAELSDDEWNALAAKAIADRNGAADLSHAITTLEIAQDTVQTNEPINRAEGNIEQADLELQVDASIQTALDYLHDVEGEAEAPDESELA